jgi:BMFP domain-containing protein YqiC
MTQTSNKLFDDFAKLLTNAAGAAQGVRREIDTVMRSQAERILNELDVVNREEFDAVRDMAAKAREENEALEKRIAALEAKLGVKAAAAAKPARARKTAAKPRAKRPGSL